MSDINAQWSVYMIRFAGDRLYTGVTTDVQRRFAEHSSEGVKSAKALRGKGPFELVYTETVGEKSVALKREWAIKQLSKPQKIALIQAATE